MVFKGVFKYPDRRVGGRKSGRDGTSTPEWSCTGEGGSLDRRWTTVSTVNLNQDLNGTLVSSMVVVPLQSVVLVLEVSDTLVPPEGPGGSHVTTDSNVDVKPVDDNTGPPSRGLTRVGEFSCPSETRCQC